MIDDFSVIGQNANAVGFGQEINKPGIDLNQTLLSHDREIQANTNRMNELEQKILQLEKNIEILELKMKSIRLGITNIENIILKNLQ